MTEPRCFYCNRSPWAAPDGTIFGQLRRTNFLPRSMGGRGLENKVDACEICRVRKGGLHPAEWLLMCPAQGRERVRAKLAELGISHRPPRNELRRTDVPSGLRLGPCMGKVAYQTAAMAGAARRRDFPYASPSEVAAYRCPACEKWHVGHIRNDWVRAQRTD
jgi:hypothetical protein